METISIFETKEKNTKKGIKTHAYEKGKKYIYDNTVGLIYEH